MDFEKKYAQFLEMVEKRIEKTIKVTAPNSLYEPFHYIMSGGGKRVRPVLTMSAAAAVSGEGTEALNAAVAIEILHNFTLVHDDIMDRSPIRRGKETIHKKWNDASAILTGDVMIGFGYRLLGSFSRNPNYPKILDAYSEGLIQVCEGQAYDMDFNDDPEVDLEDYFKMIDKKTAKILECCVALGAYAAGGSDEQVAALKNYANSVGIAFQIQDDILDIVANNSKFGKKVGQDIIEGKKTYLMLTARDKVDNIDQAALIDKFFHGNGLNESYISQFKRIFEDYDVFGDAQLEIDTRLSSARNSLSVFPDNDGKAMLLGLVEKLNKRQY